MAQSKAFANDMSAASAAMGVAVPEVTEQQKRQASLVCAGAVHDPSELSTVLEALGLKEPR